jgi:hypothetical protein
MKVLRNKPKFQPVSIVLETEEELQAFVKVINNSIHHEGCDCEFDSVCEHELLSTKERDLAIGIYDELTFMEE